jgi:hypothetical protein
MQLSNVLNILLGAALVSVGVLVAALAERLRGSRAAREAARVSRAQPPAPRVISVVEPIRAPADKQGRAPRAEPRDAAGTSGGDDVIAALVAAGYKKPVAAEATWGCSAAERATVERWTASALRRCARGGMS